MTGRMLTIGLVLIALGSAPGAGAKSVPTPRVTRISVDPVARTISAGRGQRFAANASFDVASPRVLSATPIAAGGGHSCALLVDGAVDCWGSNASGQLGNGTFADSSRPVSVTGITGAIALSAGRDHACALLAGGTVACWGDNFSGQLGDGSFATSNTPVAVLGISTATAISAGEQHTCAVLADGTLRCWGRNLSGQLGDGIIADSGAPVQVLGITSATSVAAGGEHSCALLAEGVARCWGKNLSGQLGDGMNADSPVPVSVAGIENATALSTGGEHSCALLGNGAVECWGENSEGRLGNGLPGNSSVPVAVSGVAAATAVSAGAAHTCVALADGSVSCWGSNGFGQVGSGSTAGGSFGTPIAVSAIAMVTAVAAGGAHTCAALSDGTVECWGANDIGQLGNGRNTGPESCGVAMMDPCSTTPVLAGGIGTAMVTAGGAHTCALFTDGTVSCWGANGSSTPAVLSAIPGATSISAGAAHTCVVVSDGTLRCWGQNSVGQLGNGTTASSAVPVAVSGITSATAVSVGGSQSCALLADGTVRCWGFAATGALGNGSSTGPQTCKINDMTDAACSTTPVAVSGIMTAVAISVGGAHACAALSDGTVRCWGQNSDGQLGNGTNSGPELCQQIVACSTTPVASGGVATAATVSAGAAHTCALLDTGSLLCWGHNGFGQLGTGIGGGHLSAPASVVGIAAAVAISAGNAHTCARLLDSTLSCWGSNGFGQLGSGTTGGSSPTPAAVGALSKVASIAAGSQALHVCVGLADGTLSCWGNNSSGQLGNGTLGSSINLPAAVSGIFDAMAPVSWSSSDRSVAAIDAYGNATGLSVGTALITAAAANFGESGLATLEVPQPGPASASSAALLALALLPGLRTRSGSMRASRSPRRRSGASRRASAAPSSSGRSCS